jgi:hypothetical protein
MYLIDYFVTFDGYYLIKIFYCKKFNYILNS